MGTHRRNRQSSRASSDASHPPPPVPNGGSSATTKGQELLEAVEEVQDFCFHISSTEMTILSVLLLSIVLSTLLLAMAAEISISIHFFDKPAPPVFSELDQREQELRNQRHRITLPEQDVHAFPGVRHDAQKLRLQRVIHVPPSGYPRTMLVVEDSRMEDDRSSSIKRPQLESSVSENAGKQSTSPPEIDIGSAVAHLPRQCADGVTTGFESWSDLKAAITEANKISVEKFVRWSRFFADSGFTGTFEDDRLYYEEEVVFTICPGAKLQARKGPIFINTPNIILECEGCVVNVGASHFSFGPNAKNVLVRGFTFTKAWSSSLLFFHNGAKVTFEDCLWHGNAAINNRYGAVADINSTSVVNFYRCNIDQGRKGESDLASSLSIRS